MSPRRLVVPAGFLVAGERALPDDLAHYARDVLRLDAGSMLQLFDGTGKSAGAEVVHIDRRAVRLLLGDPIVVARAPGPTITLLQALGKGDKLDTVVRQSTELGVSCIVPVISARVVSKQEVKLERLRSVAEDALRVSGRCFRPKIEAPIELEPLFARPRSELSLALALEVRPLREVLGEARLRPASIEILIGPEGGFSQVELEQAQAAGFLCAGLGPFTLRTETAGPAAVALLAHWAGLLG